MPTLSRRRWDTGDGCPSPPWRSVRTCLVPRGARNGSSGPQRNHEAIPYLWLDRAAGALYCRPCVASLGHRKRLPKRALAFRPNVPGIENDRRHKLFWTHQKQFSKFTNFFFQRIRALRSAIKPTGGKTNYPRLHYGITGRSAPSTIYVPATIPKARAIRYHGRVP